MENLNEKDDVNTILDDIAAVVKGVNFYNMGKALKRAGYKYDFQSSMMPMYMIDVDGHRFGLLHRSYVDKADRMIGDFALGLLESTVFVHEGKSYTAKEIAKIWDKSFGEDMEDEYPGFYKNIKRMGKLTKDDLVYQWDMDYGEDMEDPDNGYLGFLTALGESKMVNEGQFSWFTQDTGRQIGSERRNTIVVYMFDNHGNSWFEDEYEGYGVFGGKDYYELMAEMNGFSEGDVKGKGAFDTLRNIGIDLAFGKLKPKGGKKVLFPALVQDKRFNWKKHDFTQEPESDPNQGWMESVETPAFESVHVPTYSEFLKENVELNERKLMSRTVGIAPEKGYFKLEDRTKAALIEIIDDVFKDDFLREEGWEYGRFFNSGYTGVTFKLFTDPKEYHLIVNMGTMGLENQSVGYAYIQYQDKRLAETPENLRRGRRYGDYKMGQKTMDAAKEMLRKFVESKM